MSHTDWDRELKRIEREFQSGSGDPFIRLEHSKKPAARSAREQRGGPRSGSPLAVWGRLALVIALAAGMYYWPYAHSCGVGLYSWMGAAVLMAVGALWVAASSWQARMAHAHAAAMALFIVSLGLLASQVLPRVGYARFDGPAAPSWTCRGG